MDAGHFDRLVRSWSRFSRSRRSLLATLPLLGGLAGLFDLEDDVAAKGRRKRRKKRHKHGQGRDKGKRKQQQCKPHSQSRTCQGRCGPVKNNCKKSVDCGPCACEPACSAANAPDCVDAACVCTANGNTPCPGDTCCADGCVDLDTDAENCGACGAACPVGEACLGGNCEVTCGGVVCDPASEICVDDLCQTCNITCTASDHTCSGADLQAALDAGGTYYVCPGIYTGNFSVLPTPAGITVTLIGAGEGDDPQRDTILDGNASGRVLNIPRASGLTGATVSLRRVRLRNGALVNNAGGGIRNEGTRLTMRECTVTGNRVTGDRSPGSPSAVVGGGILSGAELLMVDCTVSNNSVTQMKNDANFSARGGGIASGSPLEMTGCRIVDNTVTSHFFALGGGVAYGANLAKLTDCEISGNTLLDAATKVGSGIFVSNTGEVQLANSVVAGNTPDPQCDGNVTGEGCPA